MNNIQIVNNINYIDTLDGVQCVLAGTQVKPPSVIMCVVQCMLLVTRPVTMYTLCLTPRILTFNSPCGLHLLFIL